MEEPGLSEQARGGSAGRGSRAQVTDVVAAVAGPAILPLTPVRVCCQLRGQAPPFRPSTPGGPCGWVFPEGASEAPAQHCLTEVVGSLSELLVAPLSIHADLYAPFTLPWIDVARATPTDDTG